MSARTIITLRARSFHYVVEDDIYDDGSWAGTPDKCRTLVGALWAAWWSRRYSDKATRIVRVTQ